MTPKTAIDLQRVAYNLLYIGLDYGSISRAIIAEASDFGGASLSQAEIYSIYLEADRAFMAGHTLDEAFPLERIEA